METPPSFQGMQPIPKGKGPLSVLECMALLWRSRGTERPQNFGI